MSNPQKKNVWCISSQRWEGPTWSKLSCQSGLIEDRLIISDIVKAATFNLKIDFTYGSCDRTIKLTRTLGASLNIH